METILLVEKDEEKIWKIIEKVNVYKKRFKNLNIATERNIAIECVERYGFDVMIVDSDCEEILDYVEEKYKSNDELKVLILNDSGNDHSENSYSFNNKVIRLDEIDNELKIIFE